MTVHLSTLDHDPSSPGSCVLTGIGMVHQSKGHLLAGGGRLEVLLADLPLEQRLTALAVYELARDRAMGQPLETAAATLRAAATAEGLDASHDWIPAAAARISAEKGP